MLRTFLKVLLVAVLFFAAIVALLLKNICA